MEIKFINPSRNKHEEIVGRFLIKAGDWTTADWEFFKQMDLNGDTPDVSFEGLSKAKDGAQEEKQKNNYQKLAFLMGKYCEQMGTDIEDEKKRLYNRYGITSRSQLKQNEIEREISIYNTGIIYEN